MTAQLADAPVPAGSHVCWVVGAEDDYVAAAAAFLRDAASANEKPIAFGPAASSDLSALASRAAIATDPHAAFLRRGPLEPEVMFAMFREQTRVARAEGYAGLRVVADMEWLLPAEPDEADIVGFELLLDREARELDATIVCAYRDHAFDTDIRNGVRCVHPVGIGRDAAPPFSLVAGDLGWRLRGEVDIAVGKSFATAIRTACATTGPCTVDAADLAFIDLFGMREIAEAARTSSRVRILGAPRLLRRGWEAAGLADAAPCVELLG